MANLARLGPAQNDEPVTTTRREGEFPMESYSKTIAKRVRVEPRTQMHTTMKMLFRINIWSWILLGSDMIVLDIVLKIWMELIK